jgi:ribose-phosphate pyrophosphokinase
MSHLDADKLKVFTGRANPQLAQKICDYLQIPLGNGRTDLFPDGELIVKVDEDVRGRDCFIVQSTSHPVNAHLMELFIWIDTLKRASAQRVTAVIPYFGYARQDRKDEGRTPITAKLVANLLERAGADRVVSVDLHAAQVQGFFDIPVDHLNAGPVFKKWFHSLGVENTVFDKRRKSGSEVDVAHIIGDVEGKTVLMTDDMITTGGTIAGACKILLDHGAKDIYISATHGIFAPPAMQRLAKAKFTKLAITDTLPIGNRGDPISDRMVVLSVSVLLGEAIHRIHHNESVSALFKREDGKSGMK